MRKKRLSKLINKVSGHTLFYEDTEYSGYQFYTKLNDMYDLSVLVFHPEEKTFREYIVDTASFLAIYEFSKDMNFNSHSRFTKPGARPNSVRSLIDDANYTLIKVGGSKIIKSYIAAKMVEFTRGEDRVKALDLKRVVVRPEKGSPLVGVDSLTLPYDTAVAFIDFAKDLFKNVDIELDLEEVLNG